MISETVFEILRQDGVVAIATNGKDGVHLVNTWNKYINFNQAGHWLVPAGRMQKTEKNVSADPKVLLTIGSSHVKGLHGPGCGFLIEGTAVFLKEGLDYEFMKSKFPWLRAVLSVTVKSAIQTL